MIPDSLLRSAADLQADAADGAVEPHAPRGVEDVAVVSVGVPGESIAGAHGEPQMAGDADERVDFRFRDEEVLARAERLADQPPAIEDLRRAI